MKKVVFMLVCGLLMMGAIRAESLLIEVKGNYFRPTSSDFRMFYDSRLQYGAEIRLSIGYVKAYQWLTIIS